MGTLTGGPAPRAEIPRAPEIKQWLYDNAILGETRRFRQLDRYEAFFGCRAYNHQPSDWDGLSADQMETVSPEVQVPYGFTQPAMDIKVRQKRPTAPSNVCKAIVERFTGLLFSESRRPEILVEGDHETEDFLVAAREQMRFWPKMREARNMGGATGAVLVTAHLRNGSFSLEVHNPKDCQIVWRDRRTMVPAAVLILWRYDQEEDIVDPKTKEVKGTRTVQYLYRRIITEDDDTVYMPVKLVPGASLAWVPESTVVHNLGFFPGVWVQNRPPADLRSHDGDPDCQGAWQTIDTYDRLLAQMNKGTLLNLDPTPVIRMSPKDVAALQELQKGSEHAIYVGENGDAKYMEITGSGITVGDKVLDRLERNIMRITRCVFLDPEKLSGSAQSAKAMEYIFAQMIEAADDLRASYGDMLMMPLLLIIEKMARKLSSTSVELPPDEDGTPRIGRIVFNLPPKFTAEGEAIEQRLGPGGYIRIKWGAYFAPTEQDKGQAITNNVSAKQGGLIDHETAVKATAPLYEVRDTATMLENIKAEEEELEARMLAGAGGGLPIDSVDEPPGGDRGPAAGQGGKP